MKPRVDDQLPCVSLDDLHGEEVATWMCRSPQQRWTETMRFAGWHHAHAGTSDSDSDPSSPFYDP